jgi:hypothetical protein
VIASHQLAEPGDVQARLYQGTDEFGLRYSSSRRRAADGADARRQSRSSAGCTITTSGYDLRHGQLRSYQQYYNGTRTHLALAKDSPLTRSVQAIGSTLPLPILGGLHHRYVRV